MILLGAARKKKGGLPRPDRRAVWREVATLLGGRLVEGKREGQDKVLVAHGPWWIWLDTYTVSTGQVTVTYTRAAALFAGWRELRVGVRPVNVFDRLWRVFFHKEIRGVSRAFLEKRVVSGKPRTRVPSLLMASGLADAIFEAGDAGLAVGRAPRKARKEHGEDLGSVTCHVAGVLGDVTRLAAMVRLVGVTLDALADIGESNREEVEHP